MLHQLRWRKSPPERGRRWLALAMVLALHVFFAWLTWHEMQLKKAAERAEDERTGALQVRLIARPPAPSAAAAPPELQLPTPPQPASPPRPVNKPAVHEAPAKNAMTVSLPPAPANPSPAAAQPDLYNASGQAALPAAASTAAPVPEAGYVQNKPTGDSKIMQHTTSVPYQATRFDKNWDKSSGNAYQDALKHARDNTTHSRTFHFAPGVRLHCEVSFAALAGGCGGDPPPPASYKDRDMRMNMAPANQLAPGTPQPKPITLDECIDIYRADKPLPYGCPVDTPARAVDAEIRERAAHHGESGEP